MCADLGVRTNTEVIGDNQMSLCTFHYWLQANNGRVGVGMGEESLDAYIRKKDAYLLKGGWRYAPSLPVNHGALLLVESVAASERR